MAQTLHNLIDINSIQVRNDGESMPKCMRTNGRITKFQNRQSTLFNGFCDVLRQIRGRVGTSGIGRKERVVSFCCLYIVYSSI